MNPERHTSIARSLTIHHGIDAVLLGDAYAAREVNSPVAAPVLAEIRTISDLVHDDVRAIVGAYTIMARHDPEETIIVAVQTGHPICKSLNRLIRQAKKTRLR